ncbi:S-adenosyl-L-methionine-dependent methyltransferase [Glonium stellatum]|uniref:S-adenosyl-L-methionine-dependent methyltransferase n=1 Tax=Glonium stellatum TaxID=574774 RepID=A0A8E2JMJ4_9PEZI|nr:S-adenosyl-L-methionine-dependent methyltransferase [Glonium stellatum]
MASSSLSRISTNSNNLVLPLNMEPSTYAVCQYSKTSEKLAARLAILSYNTNRQGWFSWLEECLRVACDVLELREFGISSAAIEQCGAADLPFPDASFDLVIANHMLYHLDDPGLAIKEFSRVLRPGGRLTVALNGRRHIEELLEIRSAIGRPRVILKAARITAETGPESPPNHFKDVRAEPFPGEFDIPKLEPILAYMAGWGDEPLTTEQMDSARSLIESGTIAEGSFRAKSENTTVSCCLIFACRRQFPWDIHDPLCCLLDCRVVAIMKNSATCKVLGMVNEE